MAWIESHDSIWEHYKTLNLAKQLGIPLYAAVGLLHGLWHFVLRNAWKDANLEPWGDDGIEYGCHWDGEKGVLVKALRECGFMDNFVVHGWLEKAGRLVYERKRNIYRRKAAVNRRSISGKSKATETLPYPTLQKPTTTPGVEVRKSFQKPTPFEVEDYARTIDFRLDGRAFVDFYESKGWMIGKSPMKNWQAAVRTWKQKRQEETPNAPHGSTSPDYYASVARRAKAAQGLRKVSSPGEILAGIRVVPDVSPGAQDGAGAGFPADGRPLGPVGKDGTGH